MDKEYFIHNSTQAYIWRDIKKKNRERESLKRTTEWKKRKKREKEKDRGCGGNCEGHRASGL